MSLSVEDFWDYLLSRNAEQITFAWRTLDAEEQRAVWAHLGRMISEEGWLDSQRESAQAAIAALQAADLAPSD